MPRRWVLKPNPKGAGRPRKPRPKGGRPTHYTPRMAEFAEGYAQMGYNDSEIAEKLKIARSKFYEYCKKFPEFGDKIENGRLQSLTGISFKAMAKALQGGTRERTKHIEVKDADGNIREIREEKTVEEVWPCKDTALKHLAATHKHYKGIQQSLPVSELINALGNIDKEAQRIEANIKDEIDTEANTIDI